MTKVTIFIHFLNVASVSGTLFPSMFLSTANSTLLADGDQTQSAMRVKHSFVKRFRGFAQIGASPIA